MKITINTAQLKTALTALKGFTTANKHLPVLNSVLFTAEGSTATLVATDLGTAIRAELPCTVTEAGRSFSLPIKALAETLKSTEAETVELARNGNRVEVVADSLTTALPCFNGEDFPNVLNVKAETAPVDRSILAALIDKALYAASEDETRYNLNSVYLRPDRQHAIATDGHRLVLLENVNLPIDREFLLSRVAVEHLARVLKAAKKAETAMGLGARATADNETAVIRCGAFTLTTKQVNGVFPDYQQVIPKAHKNDIVVGVATEPLIKALKAVKVAARRYNEVPVRMEFLPGVLNLTTKDKDGNERATQIAAANESQSFVIGFNPDYLIQALETFDGKFAVFNMSQPENPAMIEDSANGQHKCVIMPMRLDPPKAEKKKKSA